LTNTKEKKEHQQEVAKPEQEVADGMESRVGTFRAVQQELPKPLKVKARRQTCQQTRPISIGHKMQEVKPLTPQEPPKPLGQKIQEIRKARRLTQQQLAEKAKTTQSRISALEKGGIQKIPFDEVINIAKALEVSLDIFGYGDQDFSNALDQIKKEEAPSNETAAR